jgi:glutaconate CoA-transferase subunit A
MSMAEIARLREAVRTLVTDRQVVALEGFTHLIPYRAGHELVREGRRELTLVRMTPDVIYDQLIGWGCTRKLQLEEHSHAGLAAAYAPGEREGSR